MKKLVVCGLVLGFVAVLFSGCASVMPQGMGYMKLKLPLVATGNGTAAPKVGIAQCTTYCGVYAVGDLSLKTAMKNGGITKIHYVDWEVDSIAGIIGKYKVVVYGE